jgi:hypothetical protein
LQEPPFIYKELFAKGENVHALKKRELEVANGKNWNSEAKALATKTGN